VNALGKTDAAIASEFHGNIFDPLNDGELLGLAAAQCDSIVSAENSLLISLLPGNFAMQIDVGIDF
jgi:hypothetical protein